MSFFSKKWVRYGLIPAAAVVAAGGIFLKSRSGELPVIYEVKRDDVVSEISLTGSIKALREVSIGFEKGGKIAGSYVKIGDRVIAGEDLIRLDGSGVYADLLGAQATLKQYQADLAALLRGKRPEEIAIDETKIQNADQSLADYKRVLANTISDGYTKVDDAIRAKSDDTFADPRTAPRFIYTLSDSTLKNRLELNRFKLESLLNDYQGVLAALDPSAGDFSKETAVAGDTLEAAASFLADLAAALNSLRASSNLSETTLDGYRTDVATARTNVNTATSNLSAAENNVRSAEAALRLAKDQLNLDKASPTAEAVASAEAKADAAGATVLKYQAEFLKMTIRSPIDGVVTKQDQRAGEIVTAGESVITIESSDDLEIEASAPEVDVGALKVGMEAIFTLDAFPDSEFTGVIVKIDPAETVVEGVPTYTITFKIDKTKDGVKPGMTANVVIVTEKRTNVLTIPLRAVESLEDGAYVDVLGPDSARVSRKIIVGLRGTDGSVEIVEGLSAGEKVFLDRETE